MSGGDQVYLERMQSASLLIGEQGWGVHGDRTDDRRQFPITLANESPERH